MILHNMIVRFEARRGRTGLNGGSMEWAIQEGRELDDNDNVNVEGLQEGGTEGQQFRGLLVERLIQQRRIPI